MYHPSRQLEPVPIVRFLTPPWYGQPRTPSIRIVPTGYAYPPPPSFQASDPARQVSPTNVWRSLPQFYTNPAAAVGLDAQARDPVHQVSPTNVWRSLPQFYTNPAAAVGLDAQARDPVHQVSPTNVWRSLPQFYTNPAAAVGLDAQARHPVHQVSRHDVRPPQPLYYANPAAAVGLPVDAQLPLFFPDRQLAVFRGHTRRFLHIRGYWDDERLLQELSSMYDQLRGWRKYFSLKGLRTIVMVPANDNDFFAYPQQIFPDPSISKGLRFRYFLCHTHTLRHQKSFMHALTASPDRGIQFTERWQVSRIVIVVLTAVASTTVTAALYAHVKHDVSGAFTIAGYMTGALAVICILFGVLNLIEFK